MKKSKFITGLSATFICAMALMSCSSLIRGKDGVVLTIDGIDYTAQDLFGDQKTPAAAEAKFNAVYKVAVRAYFRKNTGDEEEIKKNTQIKISEQKATAQSNADKNGTSYDEEWQKILDSNGVEDEQGLYDKFEYELQKEKFENRFYDENYKALRSGKKDDPTNPLPPGFEDLTNYLDGKQPYHIKHILVKLANAKAGDGVNVEISADEARKLGSLIENLARGDSFESLASTDYNDDETARKNSGSLGIMSRDTSFVNDFKFGIYMYESFYGSSTQTAGGAYEAKVAKTELGLNETVEGTAGDFANKISTLEDPSTNNLGIGQIPYEAAEKLFNYADYDFGNSKDAEKVKQRFSSAGLSSSDVGAKYYPRNVIFNKYFNKHNIMVITPRKLHSYTTTGNKNITDWTTDGKIRNEKYDQYLGTVDDGYASLTGFKRLHKNDDALVKELPQEGTRKTEDVLRDENGRVILVFHSGTGDSSSNDAYQGIHFVVIERSPFIGKEFDGDSSKDTSLDEYYTEYYPGQSGGKHPTYSDGTNKRTFVNYFPYLESKDLKARADTVKDELKKCDPKLDTYLYQNLVKTGEIKFNPDMKEKYHIDIEKDINDWITISRVTYKREQKRTWDDTWQDYYFSLESQVEQRKEYAEVEKDVAGEEKIVRIYSKLIPEACFYSFVSDSFNTNELGLKQLFGEGGIFHD